MKPTPCARFPTARAWNACSPFILPLSRRSKSSVQVEFVARSSTTCAIDRARKRLVLRTRPLPDMRKAMFQFEERSYRQGWKIIAGVDEAGRGPLAGPVVAAAVVLPRKFSHETLNDSKQLTAAHRDELFSFLTN